MFSICRRQPASAVTIASCSQLLQHPTRGEAAAAPLCYLQMYAPGATHTGLVQEASHSHLLSTSARVTLVAWRSTATDQDMQTKWRLSHTGTHTGSSDTINQPSLIPYLTCTHRVLASPRL